MSNDFAEVTVARAWDEGPRLRALELDLRATGFAPRFTTPGQYLRARAPGSKEAFLAIASAPGSPRFELLVQRSPDGEPPKAADAIAAIPEGGTLEITEPAGKGYPIAGEKGRDLLLFAGGSGISAVRSLAEHIAAHRPDFGRVVLLYGARSIDEMAYRSLFDGWTRRAIDVVPVLSRSAAGSWSGRQGYVQQCLPELALDPSRVSAFVTGGKPFDAAVCEALGKLGVTRIFRNF